MSFFLPLFLPLPLGALPPAVKSVRWYFYQDTQGVNRILQVLVNNTWAPVDEYREDL